MKNLASTIFLSFILSGYGQISSMKCNEAPCFVTSLQLPTSYKGTYNQQRNDVLLKSITTHLEDILEDEDQYDAKQTPQKLSVLSTPFGELAEVLGGKGRAKMVWKLLRNGIDPVGDSVPEEMLTKKTLTMLQRAQAPWSWKVTKQSVASCGTRKILLQLQDGLEVETVIIPSGKRSTVCVSSQIGCERACQFCMTGTMGLIRNLNVEEILAQVFQAKRICRIHEMPPLTNIVFMGMGEPLNNFKNVKQALNILTYDHQFSFGKSHIVVSTVGPSPYIIRQMSELPAKFAWSVHAATDEARLSLVPTTAHPMEELRDAFSEVLAKTNSDLFVECTMINDVTDTPELAEALAELLQPLPGKPKVNLLPYNDIGHPTYRQSPPENVQRFLKIIKKNGIHCTVRTTRGDEEHAACGQLATTSSIAPFQKLQR